MNLLVKIQWILFLQNTQERCWMPVKNIACLVNGHRCEDRNWSNILKVITFPFYDYVDWWMGTQIITRYLKLSRVRIGSTHSILWLSKFRIHVFHLYDWMLSDSKSVFEVRKVVFSFINPQCCTDSNFIMKGPDERKRNQKHASFIPLDLSLIHISEPTRPY